MLKGSFLVPRQFGSRPSPKSIHVKYWEKAVLELGRVSKNFIFPFQNATALTFASQEDSAELVRFLLLSFGDARKTLLS